MALDPSATSVPKDVKAVPAPHLPFRCSCTKHHQQLQQRRPAKMEVVFTMQSPCFNHAAFVLHHCYINCFASQSPCVTRAGTYFCSLVTPEHPSRSSTPSALYWTRVSASVLQKLRHVLTYPDAGASGDAATDKHKSNHESMHLVPILTCFIPSLERGAPFRISIHSWTKPKPSQLLLSYKTPNESTIFEARVYIDGVLVAYGFCHDVRPLC